MIIIREAYISIIINKNLLSYNYLFNHSVIASLCITICFIVSKIAHTLSFYYFHLAK